MQAALFDLDETILDRSGSLKDFVHWQASEQLGLNFNEVARFTDRFYVPINEEYELCEYADETHTDLSQLVGYVQRKG